MTAVRFGQEAVLPHQVTVSSSRISNPFAPNGSLPQSAVASSHVTFPSPVVSYVPRGLVFFAEPYPPIRSNSASVRKFPVNIGTKQKSGEADRPRFAQQIGVLPKPARSGSVSNELVARLVQAIQPTCPPFCSTPVHTDNSSLSHRNRGTGTWPLFSRKSTAILHSISSAFPNWQKES